MDIRLMTQWPELFTPRGKTQYDGNKCKKMSIILNLTLNNSDFLLAEGIQIISVQKANLMET